MIFFLGNFYFFTKKNWFSSDFLTFYWLYFVISTLFTLKIFIKIPFCPFHRSTILVQTVQITQQIFQLSRQVNIDHLGTNQEQYFVQNQNKVFIKNPGGFLKYSSSRISKSETKTLLTDTQILFNCEVCFEFYDK